jgi:predicted esterase
VFGSLLAAMILSQTPCPRGWTELSGDACLLKGEAEGLIVYFHGMMAPTPRTLGWELSFISVAAKRRHVPVIVLRGTPGLCDWAADYKDWWCWPSARTRLPDVGTTLERLDGVLVAATQALGRPLPAPLFVGYSNGGYFLTMVMGDTKALASGFVVMNGGPVKGVAFLPERRAPTLLISGVDDTIQRPAMESLRATLESAAWTPSWFLRKGSHPPEPEDFARVLEFAAGLTWR